jgi:hypothetical protein
MNKFDTTFFKKYIPEWQEIKEVIHTHFIDILSSLITKMFLFVFIPVILYKEALLIREILPFRYLEIYLFLIYIRLMYEVFNWYNDVWIVTNEWVVCLVRSFLKVKSETISYENIEWVSVEQIGLIDKVLSKWDVIINKFWEDEIVLVNASSPFKAVDLIESFKQAKETLPEEDKFNMLMDTLGWVVNNYLHEKKDDEVEDEKKGDEVEKVKEEEGTIDLR